MSLHQTLTLLSKADGSIDSIFSPSCCCDPETALWLDLDTRRENDGGNIKRKRVVYNNRHSFLPSFSPALPPFLPAHPPSHLNSLDMIHAMSSMHMLQWHQMPSINGSAPPCFLVMGAYSSPGSYVSLIFLLHQRKGGEERKREQWWQQYRSSGIMWITAAGPIQTHLSYSALSLAILQTDNQSTLGLPNEDHLHWQPGPPFH